MGQQSPARDAGRSRGTDTRPDVVRRPRARSGSGNVPPLKWAGGKRWQVPHLSRYWQRHRCRRLVEPFCGGLAVAITLMPERALLNDINPHVINFYTWVKRGLTITEPLA